MLRGLFRRVLTTSENFNDFVKWIHKFNFVLWRFKTPHFELLSLPVKGVEGGLGWNTTGVVGNDLEVCPWCNRGLVKPVKFE